MVASREDEMCNYHAIGERNAQLSRRGAHDFGGMFVVIGACMDSYAILYVKGRRTTNSGKEGWRAQRSWIARGNQYVIVRDVWPLFSLASW